MFGHMIIDKIIEADLVCAYSIGVSVWKEESAIILNDFINDYIFKPTKISCTVNPLINPAHPASSAYRITMSPHEWTWSRNEIEAMAKFIVENDDPYTDR